jgi:hypothetical protein
VDEVPTKKATELWVEEENVYFVVECIICFFKFTFFEV